MDYGGIGKKRLNHDGRIILYLGKKFLIIPVTLGVSSRDEYRPAHRQNFVK